jgi:glutamate/tyrosine decarboxylase-like PLP-dependent enzyme
MIFLPKIETAHLRADVDLFRVQLVRRTKEVASAFAVEQFSADKVEKLDNALETTPAIYVNVS